MAYLPCLVSTSLAAAVMESSSLTSSCNSSTVPGWLLDCSCSKAALPLSSDRLPRRTCLVESARRSDASSNPMPPLA